jgi:DNA-binding GntR family transcriptional regulator
MAEIIHFSSLGLAHHAATQLRTQLIEGGIAPGAKLNERLLAQRLNVSRTPLREAIKMLAQEGLVDLLPNRGAVAVKLTREDVVHSFEVLAGLEALSGRFAAQRITDAELAEMRALHFEMLAAHARADLSSYYRLNAKIHNAINAAAKNPVLTQTYARTNARVQSLRFKTNQDAHKWRRAVHEHERMMEALSQRDGEALAQLLTDHLRHKLDTVLGVLDAGDHLMVSP